MILEIILGGVLLGLLLALFGIKISGKFLWRIVLDRDTSWMK